MCLYPLFILTPIAPPIIQGEETEQFTVKVGETVVLPCSVRGKPTPEVFWRKNFVRFSPESSEHFLFSDIGLTIFNTEISDRAIYECVASNIAGETTKIITLIVQSKSVVILKCIRSPENIFTFISLNKSNCTNTGGIFLSREYSHCIDCKS